MVYRLLVGKKCFSQCSWQLGDFNADGTVNAGDLNELGQNWQQSIPSAASPESIPEPSGMFLCAAGFLAALMRLHRKDGS